MWRLAPLIGGGQHDPEIKAVVTEFGPSTLDEAWVPKIAELGWLPITKDGGKRAKGRRLPAICDANGVTHVCVSETVVALGEDQLALAIARVWNDLVDAWLSPKSTRYSLHAGPGNSFVLAARFGKNQRPVAR